MNNISIFNKEDCCGCTACEFSCPKNCIHMNNDKEGFLYANVDYDKCIDCGICINVCPLKGKNINVNTHKQDFYAMKNKDEIYLKASSSGGLFYEIYRSIIQQNGIVFGVKYDENLEVVYSYSGSKEGYEEFRGSKYVQARLNDSYLKVKELLEKGVLVLFQGTPCHVDGLKYFLKKSYDNLITCDILCHGVPSPGLFKEYISFVEKKEKDKIKSINMKDKRNGWNNSIISMQLKNKRDYTYRKESKLWSELYYCNYATRPCCHSCKYTTYSRVGDITIGDLWGIEKYHNNFYDKNGVSLFISNTDKGRKIFDMIKNNMDYIPVLKKEIEQPSLIEKVKPARDRKDFWKDYESYGFEYVIEKYLDYNLKSRLKNRIKSIIITLKIRGQNAIFKEK